MAALPIEILLGIYLGLLTGIVPALVAGGLGFVFRYFTGVSLPGFGVVVLAVAVAGVNGGLLGLISPEIQNSPRLMVAVVLVMMLSLYAHGQGDKLGTRIPRRFSLRTLRKRTLSADVVEFVGGIGKVTITPTGPIEDMEGYPSLPPELREQIAEDSWKLPADLPLSELETRLVDRLRTEYDLADAAVSIDDRGRATIAAAPPMGALSRRVPDGQRAVSIGTLVPTGMARGEEVTVLTGEQAVDGTLLSAKSDAEAPSSPTTDAAVTDGGEEEEPAPKSTVAPTTTGGDGRATVAVPRRELSTLLARERGRLLVRSRGKRREFELLSLLRRGGKRIERLSVRQDGPLDGVTLGNVGVRDAYGVAVLAVRRTADIGEDRRWVFSPSGSTEIAGGDDLFVVGSRDALASFRGAIA